METCPVLSHGYNVKSFQRRLANLMCGQDDIFTGLYQTSVNSSLKETGTSAFSLMHEFGRAELLTI